ncbi:MAG: hypothetical protein U0X91_03210 [Spirosomataceae bacterium]
MTADNQTTAKFPTHTVYYLKDKEGSDRPQWIKTGVAWEHGDKDGLTLSLSILGQSLSLQVRKPKAKSE